MITITQDLTPAFLAGSPVVLRGQSDCVSVGGSSMHRIICKVTCSVYDENPYTEELVCPITPDDLTGAPFQFNLSNACKNALELSNRYKTYGAEVRPSVVSYRLTECYMLHGETTYGPDVYFRGNFYAYPGAWTDFERYSHPEYADFSYMAGSFLTRFPRSERRLAVQEREMRLPSVGQFVDGKASNYGSKKPTFHVLGVRDFEGLKFYVAPDSDDMHYMHFVNGFGLVETVFFRSDDAVVHEMDKKVYRIPPMTGFDGIDRILSYPEPVTTTIKMTTGLMSEALAEWFMFEVCASRKVWIYDRRLSEWKEGTLSADKTITPIDAAKGGGCAIEMTFHPAIQGSSLVCV